MSAGPRSRAQRRRDTEHRLAHDKDLWVASASADGTPYLVPLSFDWESDALPQERGDRFVAHAGSEAAAGRAA